MSVLETDIRVVTDANVWVVRYIEGDVHSERSRKWLDSMLVTGRLLIAPELMLLEVTSAIARRFDLEIAERVFQQMQSFQRLYYAPVD